MQALHVAVTIALAWVLSLAALALAQSNDKPILWFRFDEAGGSKIYDASGNGNTGTLAAGTTRPNDPLRRSILTPGTTLSRAVVPHVLELNPGASNFTVAYWIRNSSAWAGGFHLGKSNYDGTSAGLYFYEAAGVDRYYNGSADTLLGARSTGWKHIALVRTGTTVTPYADSVALTTGTDSRTLSNTLPFTIGGSADDAGPNTACTCAFGDLRLYYRALSAAEIRDLYREGLVARAAPRLADLVAPFLAPSLKPGAFFRFFEPQ